jgi:outer membrane protein OmpA-like peptidoglycan-associated protein
MMRAAFLTLVAATMAALFTLVAAASDIAGSAVHPLVGRYAGAEIVGYEVSDYDEANLVDGPFSPLSTTGGTGFLTVEGKVTLIYYALPAGRSTLEVLRNYETALKANGFTIAFTCATSNGSCFESGQPEAGYLLGEAVGDPLRLPKLADDYVHNWFQEGGRYLLGRLDQPGGTAYAALYIGESNTGSVAVVRVVETGAMDTGKIEVVTASQMQSALASEGRISLYGIHFDLDSAVIQPSSQPTLAEVAALLAADPSLSLRIVGHTDNWGSADYNLALSERRAGSVVAALVASYGIAPVRLFAAGAGMTQPVATNDTEEGRALNRRVELEALGAGQP